jgi:hypothetical protein
MIAIEMFRMTMPVCMTGKPAPTDCKLRLKHNRQLEEPAGIAAFSVPILFSFPRGARPKLFVKTAA